MKPTPTLLEAARALISVYDEQSQVAQRIITGGKSDRQLREDGLTALKDLREAVAALPVPAAEVVGEPVAWQPRYKQEVIDHHRSHGRDFWDYAMTVYPTREGAEGYGHGGHEARPLYAEPPVSGGWRPISEADKGIAYIHKLAGLRIGNSYPIWTRDADGRIFECVWSDDGKKAYWWDLEGESPADPVEFMPHPLDPRYAPNREAKV